MRCSKCGAENPDRAKFCVDCASPFARRCPSCNAENPPTAKFCLECAKPLNSSGKSQSVAEPATSPIQVTGTADTSLDGERKTVTALFADIKGSMELIEDLDAEEARAVIDPALKLMMGAVERYGGYVAQSTGDGIFALFGAPVAHEDHPQRAVYAALRMQEDLRRYSDQLREQGRAPLSIRVGINTGGVVVRTITTGEGHTEYLPIGHSTSLASRLQALAPPSSIAISDTVRKLVEGYFVLKPLGPARIKGVSEPVKLYEVTGLGPIRTRLQRSAGRGLVTFVGRQREMEAMKRAADQAQAGYGQIVAAIGEPGVGKSRLIFEFKAISQSEWMVLEGFSVSHGKASAYLPVIDLLYAYFDVKSEDDSRKRREKVTGRVLALDRSLEDTLPYLFSLLAIVEGVDPLAQMDGQLRKRRTLEAIKRIFLRESLNQPLIVIFEDLHWIDDDTQALLNLLADSIATARILLLVNYRPEYSHRWNSKTYYAQLRLDPLGAERADEMLTALIGDGAEVQPLKRLIIERTQGNPFFMEETVQVLLDEGALVRDAAAVRLTKPLSELKIPPTVQAILAARIDRLPPDEKDLLQTVAVIGKNLPLRLAQAVAGTSADEVGRMLDNLQLGEFIYEQPALGDVEYTFKHALTHEVAYNGLLFQQRRGLHRAVGRGIEKLYPDRLSEHYSELARHFVRAEDWPKALEYSTRAGEQSARSYSNVEAEQHYARALAAASKLPLVEPGSLADLYTKRGDVLKIVGRYDDAIADYQRARELARSARDRKREVLILFQFSLLYWETHQKDPMLEHIGQALALAREIGDKFLETWGLLRTVTARNCFGPDSRAREESEQNLNLAETTGSPVLSGLAHVNLGYLLQWQADFDRSIPHLNQAIELAEQSHQGDLYISLMHLGNAYLSRGEYEEALRCYGRFAEYADGAGHKSYMTAVANLPGGVHLELYDFNEALKNSLESYETACRLSLWTEPRGHTLTKAGLAYLGLGDFALADKFFLRAWELLEDKDEFARWRWQMVLLRGRGELALARGRRDEAWKFATESFDLANKTASRKHLARAQWLQGEILTASGRLEEAARTLDASASLAEKIGTPREVWIARSALGRVLGKLGRDNEVEAQFGKAADAIETVSSKLRRRSLNHSLLSSEAVRAVYKALGRQTPLPIA
jgi:class 3 adenylate cyclase/tetratricopeptide (TPR) repeat protein/ribosomal protein L40E